MPIYCPDVASTLCERNGTQLGWVSPFRLSAKHSIVAVNSLATVPPAMHATTEVMMTVANTNVQSCASDWHYRVTAPAASGHPVRKRVVILIVGLLVAWGLVAATAFAQTVDPDSTFSDLSTEYDGGVANPTDGSTGNVLQQTLIAAYFWGAAHGGARATVVVSSDYPIHGSRILVPGNVNLICSSYAPQTYTGGCAIYQTDPGNNTAIGGSPLLVADFSIGVLADHKTWCSFFDNPQKPGCTIINSAGASISGFTLYGSGASAGGNDIGIRVAADNVHVQDTSITGFFGGPGIQHVVGVNSSYDWNYGTNVDTWWCANPSQLTPQNLAAALLKFDGNLGGMDLMMVDGEASHNQYSTGCAFARSFNVSLEYPHLAAMNVGGAGNLIESNLLQVDGIGLIANGMEHRILSNRVEYQAREAISSQGNASIFADNRITSACLDPNLANLRPGSPDNGIPRYPSTQQFLRAGYIIMDPSGNIEQVISGNQGGNAGTSDTSVPDWAVQPGGTVETTGLTWENIGPWTPGLTDSTDPGPVPALVNGLCYPVTDIGQGNTWSDNQVGEEVEVDGWSYSRGSYKIIYPGVIRGNTCPRDWPDAYGNGQCWWGGDLYSNGGPAYLAPNGREITSSGGGTAWVGDYSIVALTDATPRHYNNFQGMSVGQSFRVTSTDVANVIDPWPFGVYGHPGVLTCTGGALVVKPGNYYDFLYETANVTQVNCPPESPTGPNSSLASVLPGSLTFASQVDGTTSVAQAVTVTNSSNAAALSLALSVSGDFAQTTTCGGSIAAGGSCTVSVVFTPTTAGVRAGALTITDNVSGLSQTVALAGLGTELSSASPTIVLSSSVNSLQVPASGQTATANIHITPQNGFLGTVNLTCQVVAEASQTPIASPICSLIATQVQISDDGGSASKLLISTLGASVATVHSKNVHFGGVSLAGLGLLGLLPFRRWRRRVSLVYLSLPLAIGMIGCGLNLNPSSAAASGATGSGYKVVITATSGTRTTSITVPLDVQ